MVKALIVKNSKQQMADENKVKAGRAGGIKIVVETLNAHISNADVCEWACAALYGMAYNNGKKRWPLRIISRQLTVAENKVNTGSAGGIGAVVKVMKTHVTNLDVYKWGCDVLWNMTSNNSKK